jgi:3',5'-cyclic AMP phosphodiesterase CpdA
MRRRAFLGMLAANSVVALAASQASQKPDSTFSFIALGDMGTGDDAQMSLANGIAAYHEKHPFDTALMLGDNLYPDGNLANVKAKFERPYAELLKRGVKFHAVLGNHDVRKGRDAEMKYADFNMNGRAYYSFVKGDNLIEFFALDSTLMTSQQLVWFETALKTSLAQWKVAYFHHPIYSSGITHGSDTKLRGQLEPLLSKYGVTAALSGHDHTYERTKPQKGVQYFVSGTGGQLRKGDLDKRTSIYDEGNDKVNSYMYFEVTPEKLSFWALDADGHTLDKGTIKRPRE